MARRSAKKGKKRTPAQPRAVPKSFCYPATLIDLRKAKLDWLFKRPEPPPPAARHPNAGRVLKRIALIRVIEDCMRADEPKKLDHQRVSAVRKPFLDPTQGVPNPLREQPECQAACRRLQQAKENKEQILIYGDYDCDGVTSVTLLYDALIAFGLRAAQIDCVIPDRLKDGYNLQWAVVDDPQKRLKKSKWRPNLVIALDCGTTAKKEVETLVGKGNNMDVIVIDHHQPDEENRLPVVPGVIHLNPKLWVGRPGWKREHRMQNMCASGLAYLFARSLLSGSPGRPKWKEARASLLAGFATCVDVMVLDGINRALLKRSLRLANRPSRLDLVPGLAELKRQVGPYPKTGLFVTEETYGFYWGPCVNAPGRMAHAYEALKLLMTRHHFRAAKLAAACIKSNRWRKATQLAMTEEARALAGDQLQRDNPPILTVSRPTWHPGVVGIVASRLRELYGRPAIVGSLLPRPTKKDPERVMWTGSGRSVKGACDLGRLLHNAVRNKAIAKGGGHPMAGGLSFSDAQRRKLAESLGNLSGFDPARYQPVVEIALPASALPPAGWATVFQRLRPFGNGNECPALIAEVADLINIRVRTRKVQTAQQQVDEADAHNDELAPVEEPEPTGRKPSKAKPNYWAFSQWEIKKLVPFVVRLRERSDEVSKYLREQLSTPTAIALEAWPYSKLSLATGVSSEEEQEGCGADPSQAHLDSQPPAQIGRLSCEIQADLEAEKLRAPGARSEPNNDPRASRPGTF